MDKMTILDKITISIKETMRVLGIGRTYVYKLIKLGKLQAVKLGKRTLITTASIRQLVDESPSIY